MIINSISVKNNNCLKNYYGAKNSFSPAFGINQSDNDVFCRNADNLKPRIHTLISQYFNNFLYKISELKGKFIQDGNREYICRNEYQVDKGIEYKKYSCINKSSENNINVISIDRKQNPDISIKPVIASDYIHSRDTVQNIMMREKGIAGINGSFFNQKTGTPLGLLKINNEILTGPVYNRCAFGINDDGYLIDRTDFIGKLKSAGEEIEITTVNQPRISDSDVILYDSNWKNTKPKLKGDKFKYIVIENNIIKNITNDESIIPDNGYVITAPVSYTDKFSIGDRVDLSYSLPGKWENMENIISAGPHLVKNGEVYNDAKEEKLYSLSAKNPRTAIGYTNDGVLKLVTVEGREGKNLGVSLDELAQIMRDLECIEAINLDGGSSSSMCIKNHEINYNDNVKSDDVNNALIIKV